MNIVIPAAGRGSRFADAGYKESKPFIRVPYKNEMGAQDTCPMIDVVIQNLPIHDNCKHTVYIILRQEDIIKHINDILWIKDKYDDLVFHVISVDKVTEGAAATVLLAKQHIDCNEELLIANCDQFAFYSESYFHIHTSTGQHDGLIFTFPGKSKKWSFAEFDEETKLVTRVAEKDPISEYATVGYYWWKHGKDFVEAAETMIKENFRVNGEFYVCPVYNFAIRAGKKIGMFPVVEMWGLGTPDDLNKFIEKFIKDKNL